MLPDLPLAGPDDWERLKKAAVGPVDLLFK